MKEAKHKRLHIAQFHLYEFPEKANLQKQESRSVDTWGWEQGPNAHGHQGTLGMMKRFTTTSWLHNFINFTTGKFKCKLYHHKNHSLDGTANVLVFRPYTASGTSTAQHQWLHFLTGKMLTAVMKHVMKKRRSFC